MDCSYVILAPEDYTLRMEFIKFNMQPCNHNRTDNDCTCDFLEVRDGRGPFSELIGTYCGYELQQEIRSSRDALYLRLVTDSLGTSTGLEAKFSIVPSSCGPYMHNLTDTSSVTLTYPLSSSGNYTNNANCLWALVLPGSDYLNMVLHFDRVDIQSGANGVCDKDYLEVYDIAHKDVIYEGLGEDVVFSGTAQTHVQVGFWDARQVRTKHVYCGSQIPPMFVSKSNQVVLKFISDSDVTGRGFAVTASKTAACRPVYNERQGRIYMNNVNVDCEFVVSVPENHTIALYFSSFMYNCQGETGMKVFDGTATTGQMTKFCGYATPDPFFSTGNQVSIKVDRQDYATFDITYLATDKGRGCGGTLFNYYGVFSSPLYPNTTRSAGECSWTVMVPTNLRVALRFEVFDMGSRQYCSSDYVAIYDVTSESQTEVSRFCGGDEPGVITGKTSVMVVRYVQTVNFPGVGFKMAFMGVHQSKWRWDINCRLNH